MKEAKRLFGDKTLEETEKTINTTKSPKKKRMFHKIQKLAIVLGITGTIAFSLRKL